MIVTKRDDTVVADRSLAERLPLLVGAVVGVVVYGAGYTLTAVLAELDSGMTRDVEIEGIEGGLLEGVGILFYNTHRIETSIFMEGDLTTSESMNFLAEGAALPEVLYYLIPIATLLLGGYVLARYTETLDHADGAKAGATLSIGYLPMAVLGAILFELGGDVEFAGQSVTVTASPEFVPAVILMGVAYPLVFGAVGGYIGHRIDQHR